MATNIPALTATRSGSWTYTVDNGRGATLTIGMEGTAGAFSPVELLQAALAGCAALSAEAQLVNKLGEDIQVSSQVEATYDAASNRIDTLKNLITTEMSTLDPERRAKLMAATVRSIGKLCTVKKSLIHGIAATTTVTDTTESPHS